MSLAMVQLCIFDEADRLFELGFADQLRLILARLSSQRQTLLFSATLPAGTPCAPPAQTGPLGLLRVLRLLTGLELRPWEIELNVGLRPQGLTSQLSHIACLAVGRSTATASTTAPPPPPNLGAPVVPCRGLLMHPMLWILCPKAAQRRRSWQLRASDTCLLGLEKTDLHDCHSRAHSWFPRSCLLFSSVNPTTAVRNHANHSARRAVNGGAKELHSWLSANLHACSTGPSTTPGLTG